MPSSSRPRRALLWLAAVCLGVCLLAPAGASAEPSSKACNGRVNDTPGKLLPCIKTDDLWAHMQAFDQIAQENPGTDGHPSRNSGEPGYFASALYVEQKMKDAGYDAHLQSYPFQYSSFVGTPTWSANGQDFALVSDWNPGNSNGDVTDAAIQPLGTNVMPPDPNGSTSTAGCDAADFQTPNPSVAGKVALIQRGGCNFGVKVLNAKDAGAVGVVIFNEGNPGRTSVLNGSLLDANNDP